MWAALVLTARLVLAFLFAVAGVAKLADLAGTRQAVVGFGVPEKASGLIGLGVPVAELAVAVLLLPGTTVIAGELGALMLLVAFGAAIALNLVRGRKPECHCFGQLHSAPAGLKTLARNCVLAGVAALALAGSFAVRDESAVAWLGRLRGAEVVAVVAGAVAIAVVTVGLVAFVSLLRSYGRVLVRLERLERLVGDDGFEPEAMETAPEIGLEPGTPAPRFSAVDLDGAAVGVDDLLAPGVPVLLVFTNPHCGPCAALLPDVARWQQEHADALTVAIVSDGYPDEVGSEAAEFDLSHVLLDRDHHLYDSYLASGTPSAVLLAVDGTIASWVAPGSRWITELVDRVLAALEREPGLPLGAVAPSLELRSLEGKSVALADLHGRETVLLFWNPGCGFCRAMHEDVLDLETRVLNGGPRLVVISSGDEARTRAERFQSLVLLDDHHEAGRAFGADGTPMALLLDSDCRVGSSVVAGSDAVLALAHGTRS